MLLDFEKLIQKYDMRISGVLHVGAHFGEEYLSYIDNGISRVVFIEPLQENFQVLETLLIVIFMESASELTSTQHYFQRK